MRQFDFYINMIFMTEILSNVSLQCSKLKFYIVHTTGALSAKIVHPAVSLCVLPYVEVLIC